MAGKKVTLKEIAQKTGVSLGTVHRAIYNKSGISEATRKRILEEVERSNYQVDEAASVLKRGAKKVMVVLPKPQNEDRFYFRGIWRGVREAAKGMEQYKIYFEMIESEYPLYQISNELERVYDEKLDEMDGLITISDSGAANLWIERFIRRGIYTVLVSSYYETETTHSLNSIKVDLVRSGRLAAEFIQYGLKQDQGKILMLCGGKNVYNNRVYAKSFEKEMQEKSYETLRVEGFGRENIEKQALEYLKNEPIKAVFSSNARNTYAICKIMDEHDLPKDILVVGTDIFEELVSYFEDGTLNGVICQYHWEQGSKAVKKIYEYLSRGFKEQENEVLPCVLIMKSNYECFLNLA